MTMMPCELHLVWDTMIIRNRMARYGPGPPVSTGGACKDPREEKYVSDLVAEGGRGAAQQRGSVLGSVGAGVKLTRLWCEGCACGDR